MSRRGFDLSSVKYVQFRTLCRQPLKRSIYNCLELEGIIGKVEFSEWATPVVHIPKVIIRNAHMAIMQ